MKKYIVEIDDQDRADEPGRPWTANLYADGDPESRGVTFGATPAEALMNLATSWEV